MVKWALAKVAPNLREQTGADDQIQLRSSDRMDIVAPSPTSVYLYRDACGILIYVGITGRGMKRQVEHNQAKEWWPLVASQAVEHYDSRSTALARERDLIERHCPPFNKQHNPNHRQLRKAYMEFLASRAVQMPLPEAIAALHERRIYLDLHDSGVHNSVLRTRMEDAQIAMALDLSDPVRTYGFSRATSVNRIEKVGPVALLHLTRKISRPYIDGHAVVHCDPKRPLEVARLRVVQLRVEKKVAA